MAIDWATTIATVTGALISGLIGILYSEYRARREKKQQLKNWYHHMMTLANRTERVASDENDYEAPYIRNSIAGNLGKLTSHILDAPEGVDDEIILEAEELAEKCQRIQAINDPSESIVMFMDQDAFLQHARSVKERSRTAKNNVGWL